MLGVRRDMEAEVSVARQSRWDDLIPWFLTIASTITLLAIAWFLVENILWFRSSAIATSDISHETYRLHVYHLHLAMIKRSVGLFSGFALLFLGTAVVFYTLRMRSDVNVGAGSLSAGVATASPGIIAMALGVILLLGTIASKDEFPPYTGESAVGQSQTPALTPQLTVVPYTPSEKTK